jgi:alpha-L-fucosidase
MTFVQLQAQEDSIRFQSTIKVEINDTNGQIIAKAAHVVPTQNQLNALQNKFIAFVHFGPNTFTRREWGTGKEDPEVFDLRELHTNQWCEAMQAAGIRMVVLVVKHHDGFCLWQTRYTTHGIMSTNFRDGKGDVLKELSESCRKYGIKLGIYLSPADLYQVESPDGLYGNGSEYTKRSIPREVPGRPFENKTKFKFEVDDYNEYFLNQLFELLTEYGPVDEIWFDGANPKSKGNQQYDYTAWRQLIRTLAPQAVIFGREDIRWCGNEGGGTRATEWNVIPYPNDPNTMTHFSDLTDNDLGSDEKLFSMQKPYYLHYQPAETNTSIRDGWFYRDDTLQSVRSADNVFDIWERAVGGNSYLMLNIPPNREGRFSSRDVEVLREAGKRIRETYSVDLFDHATLDKQPQEIMITAPSPVKFNRLKIGEPIATHGERVAKHAVDAFIDGAWKEIAQGTNIGFCRILRFPEVTTNKIRLRILKSRLTPAIGSIAAYYYNTRPPVLTGKRNSDGMLTIEPQADLFTWNATGQNSAKNLNQGYKIYYTTNGKDPNTQSTEYKTPFEMENGKVKAVAYLNGEQGAVYEDRFGYIKKDWKVIDSGAIDLGQTVNISGFAYTPQHNNHNGLIDSGIFQISDDGKVWKDVESFAFGNLVNDPTKRYHYFKEAVKTRFIRITATHSDTTGRKLNIAEMEVY